MLSGSTHVCQPGTSPFSLSAVELQTPAPPTHALLLEYRPSFGSDGCKCQGSLRTDHSPKAGSKAFKCWPFVSTMAKLLRCVRTACMLRTQRPGYSPKNTCHLTSCTAKQQSPHENDETAFKLVLHCPYEQTTQPCNECFGARGFALGGGDEVFLDSERRERAVRGLLGDGDRE